MCQRFHRTMKQEFHNITFCKKIYNSVEELQIDVNLQINKYNTQRTHLGKHCYGKISMQIFLNSKHIALEKNIPSDIIECQTSDTQHLSDNIEL